MSRRWTFPALVALYLLSGATALVYEVVFTKHLALVFGSSAPAVSTVLGAFMAGLALGSALGGRYADRLKRPLAAYALLELGIGIYALVAPLLFGGVTHAYVALSASDAAGGGAPGVRLVLGALVVVVPTTLMGVTFPLVARSGIGRSAEIQARLSRLYGANTLGAALGAFAATFILMPAIGLAGATGAAAAGNIVVSAIAFWLDRRGTPSRGGEPAADVPAAAAPDVAGGARTAVPARVLLACALLIGVASFSYEVVWTHLLAIVAGTSVFAFGLMLTAFLLAISVGGWLASLVPPRRQQQALVLAEIGVAAATVATMATYEWLPGAFSAAVWAKTFATRELVRFLICGQVVFWPAVFIGMAFPLLLSTHARQVGDLGRRIGSVSAFNTMGAIAGSLVAGFVLIPLLGTHRALVSIILLTLVVSLLLAWTGKSETGRRFPAVATALALALGSLAAFGRPLDFKKIATGSNVYFEKMAPHQEIVFSHEDSNGGLTLVTKTGSELTLTTNGKFQGNDSWEMLPQRRFTHYPMLFVGLPARQALIIGIGTGTSTAAAATYPFERIDVAELAPGIYQAARGYFGRANDRVFEDPRVHVHFNDGRNFLLLSRAQYDLITVELTSIWFASAGNLYNREFYRLARGRLAPGGVFQQWVQLHHMSKRNFITILATVRDVFPHAAFFMGGGQGILVAADHPLQADFAEIEHRNEVAAIDPRLARGMMGLPVRNWFVFFGGLTLDEEGFERFMEEGTRALGLGRPDLISTDDNLYLEYATPAGNSDLGWDTNRMLLDWMAPFADHRRFPVTNLPAWGADYVAGAAALGRNDRETARALLAEVVKTAPAEPWITRTARAAGVINPVREP